MKRTKLVDARNWRNMAGMNEQVKKINSYLTCNFILSENIPDDECEDEAITIFEQHRGGELTLAWLEKFLNRQFGHESVVERFYTEQAEGLIKILT
jgi:hypothetical protein